MPGKVYCQSLTHWSRDNMAAVSQTTHSNAFSLMKTLEFRLRFHWILFLRVQLTIIQHWFRKWIGAGQATSHYLNQLWLVYWRIYASSGLNELMEVNHIACYPWTVKFTGNLVIQKLNRRLCSDTNVNNIGEWISEISCELIIVCIIHGMQSCSICNIYARIIWHRFLQVQCAH